MALSLSVSSSSYSSSSSDSPPAGIIAGGVIGGVVGGASLSAAIIMFIIVRRRTKQDEKDNPKGDVAAEEVTKHEYAKLEGDTIIGIPKVDGSQAGTNPRELESKPLAVELPGECMKI